MALNVGGQRAGVTDAGGAAVADGVEAEGVEVWQQAGLVVVVGDDAGAGGEGGFDPGRCLEAAFDGFLGEQAGGDHNVGVGGVGAGGDGGDDDRPIAEVGVGIDAEAGLDAGGRGGVGVLAVWRAGRAGDVAVCRRDGRPRPPSEHLAGGVLVAVGAEELREFLGSWRLLWESRTRSWGRLGPATEGSTVARSSERVEEYSASGASGVWKRPCSRQ